MSEVLFTVQDRSYDADTARVKIENQDQHIGTLEQENEELRQQVEKHMESLAQIATKGASEEPTEPQSPQPTAAALGAEDIARIVQEHLVAQQQQSVVTQNASKIETYLTDKFGDKAEAEKALLDKAKELGVTPATVDRLVAESPNLILGWFGDDSTPTPSASQPTRNTLAFEGMQPSVEQGSWTWWKNVQREDPKFYKSPQGYRQRMQDAERLGREKFFGNKS